MILTVTLNPCIDQQLKIDTFTYGGMNRVVQARKDIAGKGVNVAVALSHLGNACMCTGFNYHENGVLMEEWLDERGIPHDFVCVDGAIRTNIKLFEQDTGIMTEINQPGAYVTPEAADLLRKKIKTANAEVLVLSGSRPQGIAADFYKQILDDYTGLAVLDTEGEALLGGLAAKNPPFLIKPNLFELENAFGLTHPTLKETVDLCKKLIARGLRVVCVSMGRDGALLTTERQAYFASAPIVPVRGVQGAGDSMVAGIVHAVTHSVPEEEWLRYAMAAAAASIIREGTLMCTAEDFNEMLAIIKVQPVTG